MKVMVVIALILVCLAASIAMSIAMVCTIRLQQQDDKIIGLERRIDNLAEAGQLQNTRINNLENKK